jgi:hypothetical protein
MPCETHNYVAGHGLDHTALLGHHHTSAAAETYAAGSHVAENRHGRRHCPEAAVQGCAGGPPSHPPPFPKPASGCAGPEEQGPCLQPLRRPSDGSSASRQPHQPQSNMLHMLGGLAHASAAMPTAAEPGPGCWACDPVQGLRAAAAEPAACHQPSPQPCFDPVAEVFHSWQAHPGPGPVRAAAQDLAPPQQQQLMFPPDTDKRHQHWQLQRAAADQAPRPRAHYGSSLPCESPLTQLLSTEVFHPGRSAPFPSYELLASGGAVDRATPQPPLHPWGQVQPPAPAVSQPRDAVASNGHASAWQAHGLRAGSGLETTCGARCNGLPQHHLGISASPPVHSQHLSLTSHPCSTAVARADAPQRGAAAATAAGYVPTQPASTYAAPAFNDVLNHHPYQQHSWPSHHLPAHASELFSVHNPDVTAAVATIASAAVTGFPDY